MRRLQGRHELPDVPVIVHSGNGLAGWVCLKCGLVQFNAPGLQMTAATQAIINAVPAHLRDELARVCSAVLAGLKVTPPSTS